MSQISLQKSYIVVLIMVILVVTIVTGLFMLNLYRIYTNLVFSESTEILNLYAIIANNRLKSIEHLSFEILSNNDIHQNLLGYINSDSYSAYQATNDLYTQLFTRWIMNEGVVAISFVFLDGKSVDVGRLQAGAIPEPKLQSLIDDALLLEGSIDWAANVAGDNTVTLYRLIRDISGNKFQPLGTLFITVAADFFLDYEPVISEKYRPEIICLADDNILYGSSMGIEPELILDAVVDKNSSGRMKINDQQYFMLSTQLGNNGWDLIYLLSASELLGNIKRANFGYAFVLVLIASAIAVIVSRLINGINKPLADLTNAMQTVAEGNFSVRLPEGVDESLVVITEVDQLTKGFSRMVEEIDLLINEVYAKQLIILDMRYKMLSQQINPHFIYNTLDTISWKAAESDNQDIVTMVSALSKLLRASIKGPDLITLGTELTFVEDYIRIQKIRFEERLIFNASISPSVYSQLIPRLSLQTIVENSIVHNIEKYSHPCQISIYSEIKDGTLLVHVADTGKGVDQEYIKRVLNHEVETNGKSVGLRNIDKRIKISFGDAYGIRVANKKPTGTVVTIALPCEGECCEDIINS